MIFKIFQNKTILTKTTIISISTLLLIYSFINSSLVNFVQALKIEAPELNYLTDKYPVVDSLVPTALILSIVSSIFIAPIVEEFIFRFWQINSSDKNRQNLWFLTFLLYIPILKFTPIIVVISQMTQNIYKYIIISDTNNQIYNATLSIVFSVVTVSFVKTFASLFLKIKDLDNLISLVLNNNLIRNIFVSISIPLFSILHFGITFNFLSINLITFFLYCFSSLMLTLIRINFGIKKSIIFHSMLNLLIIFSQIFMLNHSNTNYIIYFLLIPIFILQIKLICSKNLEF